MQKFDTPIQQYSASSFAKIHPQLTDAHVFIYDEQRKYFTIEFKLDCVKVEKVDF